MASEVIGYVKSKITGATYPYFNKDENGYELLDLNGEKYWSNLSNFNEVDGPEEESQEDNINKPNHYHKGGIDVLTFVQGKLSKEAIEGVLPNKRPKICNSLQRKEWHRGFKKSKILFRKAYRGVIGWGINLLCLKMCQKAFMLEKWNVFYMNTPL